MQIFINHRLAYLKQSTSFDFVAENRYFSGADSYTLAITFPLRGCAENIAIFGHINRKDVAAKTILFDCEIRDKAFVQYGSLTITEINETEVKCQFLEGRSVLNYYSSFDDIYINTLTLPYPSTDTASFAYTDNRLQSVIDNGYVALPWVNNLTGNIQNRPDGTTWHADTKGLTFQPFLWYLLSLIFAAIDYKADLTVLTATKWKYLLVCNALPFAWDKPSFAAALPNWTLTELLEQVEYLTGGEFLIDHTEKTVTFAFAGDVVAAEEPVQLEDILSEHSVAISSDEVEYRKNTTIEYADNAADTHADYYNCPWLIREAKRQDLIKTYSSMYAFATAWGNQSYNQGDNSREVAQEISALEKRKLIYIEDKQTYYMVTSFSSSIEAHGGRDPYAVGRVTATLQQVNIFAPLTESTSDNTYTLNIIPAWIDEAYLTVNDVATAQGCAIFLDLPEYDNQSSTSEGTNGLLALQIFNSGNASDTTEFLDRIYVAFYNTDVPVIAASALYCPAIASTCLWFSNGDITRAKLTNPYSLRLGQAPTASTEAEETALPSIDPNRKYTFQWLSDTIPSVRAIFYIRGKRYLCAKITATFTANGMSRLLKGEFYSIAD